MATQHCETYPSDRDSAENKISIQVQGFRLEIYSTRQTKFSCSIDENEVEIVLKTKEEKEVLNVGVQPQDERNTGAGLDTAPETSGFDTQDDDIMSEICILVRNDSSSTFQKRMANQHGETNPIDKNHGEEKISMKIDIQTKFNKTVVEILS
ncbi:uncharacterized protein LOC121428592 isoform X3 [Lytechinus variegatus]|uniref:uncharacterized protein LOC121428592 isoform X3 n=1 Tax=Lytechinus variegatus TaxID=7654 RepID=UPI001BB273D6|nr:uncharacterized protein LOC121428592 isoform X3 [Lytechinus variegatus]